MLTILLIRITSIVIKKCKVWYWPRCPISLSRSSSWPMTCVCDLWRAALPPPCRRSHSLLGTLTLSVHSCAPHSLYVRRKAWGGHRVTFTARTGSSASPHQTVQSTKSIREANMSIYCSEVGGKQFHLRCICIFVDFVWFLIYSVYPAENIVLVVRLRL